MQDPQKAVRVIARLLARHQVPLYAFLHQLHREDSTIEEFFQWLWTATTFLRRGLAEQLDLNKLLPREPDARRFLMEELDSVVEYHRRKRQRQYELMCRTSFPLHTLAILTRSARSLCRRSGWR
jgi:hypothetical protein